MKIKFLSGLFIAFLICLFVQNESKAFWFFNKKEPVQNQAVFAPVNEVSGNKIWIGTFQLVWNDLVNEIVKKPVKFKGEKNLLAESLNKQGFSTKDLDEASYYKKYGLMTPNLKEEMEKAIEEKFNTTSDILNTLDWNSNQLLIYAMLKKDFEYLKEFREIGFLPFSDNKNVKFFGAKGSKDLETFDNIEILFYNNENDYALKLITKGNDEVILYRTENNNTLENYFIELNKKTAEFKGDKKFNENDSLIVPYIKFKENFEYKELTNKKIKGSDYVISGAIQTAEFNLDNKGGSLKSEAALIMKMSMPIIQNERKFHFDKPFVLFLKEKDKQTPYFIMDVKNSNLLVKE